MCSHNSHFAVVFAKLRHSRVRIRAGVRTDVVSCVAVALPGVDGRVRLRPCTWGSRPSKSGPSLIDVSAQDIVSRDSVGARSARGLGELGRVGARAVVLACHLRLEAGVVCAVARHARAVEGAPVWTRLLVDVAARGQQGLELGFEFGFKFGFGFGLGL